MNLSKRNILLIRNDRLGDFCLALPVVSLIKHYLPEATIGLYVNSYTQEFAKSIDGISKTHIAGLLENKEILSSYEAAIALHVEKTTSISCARAGIAYRLAPATKLWQIFYNHRLKQRRSQSAKPEYAYNIDLAYQFLYDFGYTNTLITTSDRDGDYLPKELRRPILTLQKEAVQHTKNTFYSRYKLSTDHIIIMVHPGSGGSANNLRLEQYAQLINCMAQQIHQPVCFLISSGPSEISIGVKLCNMLPTVNTILLEQPDGIPGLTQYIKLCDLFISNSTGPLHIAGLLNRPTAAFYPRHRSGSPLRWQTLNSRDIRLVFVPPDDADEQDVQRINMEDSAKSIVDFINILQTHNF